MISSFRTHLLSLSLLVGVAAPWAANAQATISNVGSGSVEDRVTTLERISNAQAQLLQQLQQQLSANQNDIDQLRGQIQENSYQLNQVVERQKGLYQQIDALSSGGANAGAAAASGAVRQQPKRPLMAAMQRQRQLPLLPQPKVAMQIPTTMRQWRWYWRKNSTIRRSLRFRLL